MRGVGGPLLCIGDLIADVDQPTNYSTGDGGISSSSTPSIHLPDSHLANLFQEHYEQLNKALSATDHSWTALTLKLCSALEMANKLIQSTSSNSDMLLEKVEELKRIINRRDAAIEEVKHILAGPVKHS